MIINMAVLAALLIGFSTIFQKGRKASVEWWSKIATEVKSTKSEEGYKWLGKFPKMREWVGEKVFQNLSAFEYSIKNKDWEASVEVDRNDIEDDSIGLYAPVFQAMGQESVEHYNELVRDLLVNGFAATCYDGQPFFDTDHPVGKTTVSNASELEFGLESYMDARGAMLEFADENGRPLNITPNLLVVGTANEGHAKYLMMSDRLLETGAANPAKGTAELMVLPGLGTKWYLLDTTKGVKPLVVQIRKRGDKLISVTGETEGPVFNRRTYQYSVESRDNAGYALWQLAFGSTGTQSGGE